MSSSVCQISLETKLRRNGTTEMENGTEEVSGRDELPRLLAMAFVMQRCAGTSGRYHMVRNRLLIGSKVWPFRTWDGLNQRAKYLNEQKKALASSTQVMEFIRLRH